MGERTNKMLKQHTKKEDIERVVDLVKKYAHSDFQFTKAYNLRLGLRNIEHDFVLKTFQDFEKIRLIEEEILPRGDIGFDLYYEISNDRTLIIGVIPLKKLIFTHVILRERRWQSQLKSVNNRH